MNKALQPMAKSVNTYWILALGFLALCFFGMRIVVQWWLTEKKRQNVSPVIFWNLSLAGSLLFLIYGALRHDIVIVVGQILSYFIEIWNLQLKAYRRKLYWPLRVLLLIFPIGILIYTFRMSLGTEDFEMHWNVMVWIGLAGQALFNVRFLFQWYSSEKVGESVLPIGFWWLSITGSMLVIMYALHRSDLVLLLSQTFALGPCVRSIVLSQQNKSI